MHSSIYFFTNISGALTSYPHDYAHEIFKFAIGKAKNSVQIVLVRRGNLLHYCYVRKIQNKHYYGICLRTDHIYNNVSDLFRAFDNIYTEIVSTGILLQMDTNGRVVIGTTEFARESVEVNERASRFVKSLQFSERTTQLLPPMDFSISIRDCIELSLESSTNAEIIEAIKKYCNVYIVKTQAEIARLAEITNIINGKNKEIKQLQEAITQQDIIISNLKKEKNKIVWVLILLSIIFIGSVVVFFVMQSMNDAISDLQKKNIQLGQHVESLQKDSTDLESRLNLTLIEKDSLENTLQDSINVINNLRIEKSLMTDSLRNQRLLIAKYPLLIQDIQIANIYDNGTIETNYGGIIYSKNSMRLKPKISYVGLESGEIEMDIKWYYPNGTLVKCSNCNCPPQYTQCSYYKIQKGAHAITTNSIGGKDKGHWNKGQYRIEIWFKGNKIAEREFTIY